VLVKFLNSGDPVYGDDIGQVSLCVFILYSIVSLRC